VPKAAANETPCHETDRSCAECPHALISLFGPLRPTSGAENAFVLLTAAKSFSALLYAAAPIDFADIFAARADFVYSITKSNGAGRRNTSPRSPPLRTVIT
jgi:hypothetical protein